MKRLMSIIMVAACCTAVGWCQDVEDWVTRTLAQYPRARLLDIYKSCFQDYMGAEHLVNDLATARAYLEQEYTTTAVEDLLPWYYEPCGINGNYVRVSLRAVFDGKIKREELLDAFVCSASDPERPSVEAWADRWHEIVAIIDKMDLNLPHQQEDRDFIEQVLDQGKYAISHSSDYREAYSPHYRIIRRDIFDRRFKSLLDASCGCCP